MGTTFSNGQGASFDFKGPINGQRIFFLLAIHILFESFQTTSAKRLEKIEMLEKEGV